MSQGPENRFITSIHNLLPKDVHREKMHNAYRGGTADCWYSSPTGDLWIEYKWIDKPGKKHIVPNLSKLQQLWLRGRYEEGRNVCVVVGHPGGAVVFADPDVWEGGITKEAFESKTMTKRELVELITKNMADR